MAGKTTNYGWTKPEANDWLEIGVISEVFENIDEQMKAVEEGIIPIKKGGTGATTAEGALDNLLDGNVKVKGSNYSCVVVLNESSGRRQGFQVVGDNIYLWNQKDQSNFTSLYLYAEDNSSYLTLRVMKDGVDNYYKIFCEHNKPSGTYTGNGSATQRIISVGGIGNVLTIKSGYGVAFVTTNGAAIITSSNTCKWVSTTKLDSNKNLIIAGTEDAINKNGTTYTYEF